MWSIYCQKVGFPINNAKLFGKGNNAPAAITAHTAKVAIGIKIMHFKIVIFVFGQEH
ncbi:hypothetical protein D3C72_2002830 [compost metagenome]